MSPPPEISDDLARAFARIDDFEAVQAGVRGEELAQALARLQESLGVDDEARALIRERLDRRGELWGGGAGHVLFGIIVGLLAAELRSERPAITA